MKKVMLVLIIDGMLMWSSSSSLTPSGQDESASIGGVYCMGRLGPEGGTTDSPDCLKRPEIAGLSYRTGWNITEPQEGNYDWTAIDSVLVMVKQVNKKMMLRVIAGTATPDWVYAAGTKRFEYVDENPYHRTQGQRRYMPLPWDEVYLSKWANFVRAVGKRYCAEPAVSIVQITGPAHGGEMHLVEKSNRQKWQQVGYSKEVIVNAWMKTIDAYAGAFPGKPLAIDIADPLYPDGSLQAVLEYGFQKLGKRFCVQGNWLAAKTRDDFPPYALVKEYSEKCNAGFQMLWSVKGDGGKRMGGALRQAIDKGVAAGAIYLEIYAADVHDPGSSEHIKYAQKKLQEAEAKGEGK